MSNPVVVLASGSAVRAKMLRDAGIDIVVDPARIDEDAIKDACRAENATPEQTAETLAEMKAARIEAKHPGALIIGADQMLECESVWYDKPVDRAAAKAQLLALQGRTHRLITAVSIRRDGQYLWHRIESASLTMRALDDATVETYLDHAGPEVLHSVGVYQLEGLGAQLFAKIEGDFFTILGLPLLALLDFLRNNGVGLK